MAHTAPYHTVHTACEHCRLAFYTLLLPCEDEEEDDYDPDEEGGEDERGHGGPVQRSHA